MYGGDRTPLGSTLEDAQLISALGVCGFDVENILASVQSDACDHLAGLWYLLLEKQRKNPFTGVISANIPRGRNGRDIPALLNASSDPSSPRPGSPGVTPTPADVERYLAGARRRSNAAESSRSAAALPAANGAAGSRRSMLLDVMRSNATPASGSSPPNGRYRGSGSGSRPQSGRRREGADGPASPRGPTIVEDEDDTGDAGLGTSPPAAMQQTKSQSGASRANRMGVKTPRGIVEEEEEEGDTSSAASSGAASRRVNGTSRYRATSPPSSGSPASPRDSSPRGGSSTRASSQASSPPRGSSPKVSRDVSPRAARTSALSPLNAQPTSTSNGADSPASYHSAISSHIQTQNASAHVSMHAAIDKLSGVPPTPSNAPRDEHSQGGGFTFPRPAIPSSLNPASLDRRPSNRQSPAANQVRSSAPPGSRAPNTPPVAHATPPAHAPRPDYVPPSPLPPPSPRLTNRTVRPSTPSSMSNSHTSTPTNMQPHSNGLGVSQSANAQLRASGGDSPLSLQTPSSSGAQLTQSSSNHSLRSNTSVSSQHSGVSYKSAPLTNAFGRTISAFTGHISPSSSHSKNHGGVNRTAGLSSEPNLVRTSSNDSDPIKGPAQDVTSSSSSTPGTSKNRSRSKSFSDGLSRNRFGLTVKALLKPASNGSSALSPQIVSPAINSPLSANPDRPDKSVGGIFNKFRRPSVAAQQYQQQQMQQEQMIQMMQQQQMQQMSPMYEFPGGHLSSSVPDDAAMNRGLPSEMTLGLGSASFPGASPMR
ncbi:hypothetical protein BJ742DRAFT_234176 [Cladochytrium replicatum]|nr:hypothetical protein BJ742DRAFT_234176 [Cladochytrium replicatum]